MHRREILAFKNSDVRTVTSTLDIMEGPPWPQPVLSFFLVSNQINQNEAQEHIDQTNQSGTITLTKGLGDISRHQSFSVKGTTENHPPYQAKPLQWYQPLQWFSGPDIRCCHCRRKHNTKRWNAALTFVGLRQIWRQRRGCVITSGEQERHRWPQTVITPLRIF